MHLNRLEGSPEQREKALHYISRKATTDTALAREVVSRFTQLSPDALLQTYTVLNRTGRARGAGAPDMLIQNLPRFSHPGFVEAFALLEAADRGRDLDLLAQAAKRVATANLAQARELFVLLDRQGAWTTPPLPPKVYLDWIERNSHAAQPALRTQAARLLASLSDSALASAQTSHQVANLLDALSTDPQPQVRQAALHAAATLHDQSPRFTAVAMQLEQDAEPTVRYIASDVVDVIHHRTAPRPTVPRLTLQPQELAPDNRITAWRDILQTPVTPATRQWWMQFANQPMAANNLNTPLQYAAAFRSATLNPDLLEQARLDTLDAMHWRLLLAQFEGVPHGSTALQLPPNTPHLLRPAAVRAAQRPSPAWLTGLLQKDDAHALQANACLAATQRFDDATLDQFIDDLTHNPDADARISAALIAGLSGRRTDHLRKLLDEERRPVVRQFLLLGLWMQGQRPKLDPNIAGWLGRDGLPEPLVMLALLHRGQQSTVLDWLLNPQRSSPADRAALLGGQRFADVLTHHLPPTAPKLDVWADGELFARQIALLSAWQAVHRRDGDTQTLIDSTK